MSTKDLAKTIADLERRLKNLERINSLNKSSVRVDLTDDISTDLGISGGIFAGVEAGADATSALLVANAATKTFRQPLPPDPLVDTIPEGALWYDTDLENKPYRFESGIWLPIPVGQNGLSDSLIALITMRFATEAARDAAIPTPSQGMKAYVSATGYDYQYDSGSWVPLLQYIKKPSNQSVTNSTVLVDDNDFQVPLVPGTYRVEAFLHATGANTGGDIAIAWSYSGTTLSGNRVSRGMAVAETAGVAALGRYTGHSLTTRVPYGLEGDDTDSLNEDILLRTTTSGTLKMRWAQDTADPTATTVSAASRLYITKLNN